MHRIIVPEFGRVFAEVKIVNLEKLPIRHIAFLTPQVERERLLVEARSHYQRCLETGSPDALLYCTTSCLRKKYQPDPELVKKHNADSLNKDWQIPEGALWEQSDVVHDILALLAEQMIDMNKENQKEIKGFLNWLETQLKIQPDKRGNIGIEALTGKTQIKQYLGDYQKEENHLPFDGFWKILEKNRSRIEANIKSRELFETIKAEHERSLSRLIPLKEKLLETDWLIDRIVYKLYGLSEEEIELVENGD